MEERYPRPSREDYFDFLVRCYFGDGDDAVELCVRRAYRDLNRTLHGITAHDKAAVIRDRARALVIDRLRRLPELRIGSQRSFDAWHEDACMSVRNTFRDGQFHGFSIGHAQKWLNMSLKYVFALGDERLGGFTMIYEFCHIPVDSIVMDRLESMGSPRLSTPWSKLDDYEEYRGVQIFCRRRFEGSAPLAVEFRLWLEAPSRWNRP